MTIWDALVLGFIQGATEFLPVSSSGHLVMGQTLLGLHMAGVVFDATVHGATLVSILVAYRSRLGHLIGGVFGADGGAWRYVGLVSLATVPAALVGLLWKDQVEALFNAPRTVGIALLVTGGILWTSRAALRRQDWSAPGWGTALLVGIAQVFALVPGISRSGTTVVAALWLGVEPTEAAAFSFMMAIPALGGAAILQIPDMRAGVGGVPAAALVAGSVVAAITGILAIWAFLAMLRHRAFHRFAPYCWIVGLAFLAYLALR